LCDFETSETGTVSLCVPSPSFSFPVPGSKVQFFECRTKVLKGLARIPAYNNVVRGQCPRNDALTKEEMFFHLLQLAKLGEKRYLAEVYYVDKTASLLLGSLSLVEVEKRLTIISNKDFVTRREIIHVEPTARLKAFYDKKESGCLVQALIARKVDCMLAGSNAIPAYCRMGATFFLSP
jgi:hypothetical protein